MTRRAETLPDDPAFIFAELAAQAVAEDFPAGAKPKERAAALVDMTVHLRRYTDSQPETCWIVMRGRAPSLPEWAVAPYAQKQAMAAFVGVLVTMDKAFRPAPVPKPSLPAPRMPGKPTLRPAGKGLTPLFRK